MRVTIKKANEYLNAFKDAGVDASSFQSCWFHIPDRNDLHNEGGEITWPHAIFEGNITRLLMSSLADFAVVGEFPCPSNCSESEVYQAKLLDPSYLLHVV
jgi:hypothetical protein